MLSSLPYRGLEREHGDLSAHASARSIYGSRELVEKLDIVNELGGHTGCVNALSWSRSGTLLASGSDDTRVNLHSYPARSSNAQFELSTIIDTGHVQNVFSVKFMPNTNDTTLVTAAGDAQVRVFDLQHSPPPTKVFRSHSDRVKRIVTESSPFYFLTCSEDGEVRQWDTRQPESTYPEASPVFRPSASRSASNHVPPPLISYKNYEIELNTISCSASQPHYIALGGAHLHCFLHDRRMLGRDRLRERGDRLGPSATPELLAKATQCVRRFAPHGRKHMRAGSNGHITACKISDANPNELIVSWSADSIYSFNIAHSPDAESSQQASTAQSARGVRARESTGRKRKRPEAVESGSRPRATSDMSNEIQRICARSPPIETENGDAAATSPESEGPSQAGEPKSTEGQSSSKSEDEFLPQEIIISGEGDEPDDMEGDSEDRELEDRELEDRELEDRELEDRELEDRELEDRELEDRELEDRELEDRELEDRELEDRELEDRELEDREVEDSEFDDRELEDMEVESDGDIDPTEDYEDDDDDDDDDDDHTGDSAYWTRHLLRTRRPGLVDYDVPCTPHTRVYSGHCNIMTIKDVNFFGQDDEYVVSGSDGYSGGPGHVFIWDRHTTELVNILEGDGEVVNVIQGHPHEAMLAVAGIDHTVKIFSPDQRDQHNARLGVGIQPLDPSAWSSIRFQRLRAPRRRGPRAYGQNPGTHAESGSAQSQMTEEPVTPSEQELSENGEQVIVSYPRYPFAAADKQQQQQQLDAEDSDMDVPVAPGGLASCRCVHMQYEITSQNELARQEGMRDASLSVFLPPNANFIWED